MSLLKSIERSCINHDCHRLVRSRRVLGLRRSNVKSLFRSVSFLSPIFSLSLSSSHYIKKRQNNVQSSCCATTLQSTGGRDVVFRGSVCLSLCSRLFFGICFSFLFVSIFLSFISLFLYLSCDCVFMRAVYLPVLESKYVFRSAAIVYRVQVIPLHKKTSLGQFLASSIVSIVFPFFFFTSTYLRPYFPRSFVDYDRYRRSRIRKRRSPPSTIRF